MYINSWRESAKGTQPGSSQQCPVTRPEAMGTDRNTGGSLWTSGNAFFLRGWPSTGIGCPERLSQNHRIVGVGRDLCGSSSPTLPPKQGHLQQAMGSLSSEILKSCLDMILGNRLYMDLLEQGLLDQTTSKGPFQPQPFCDSVSLCFERNMRIQPNNMVFFKFVS